MIQLHMFKSNLKVLLGVFALISSASVSHSFPIECTKVNPTPLFNSFKTPAGAKAWLPKKIILKKSSINYFGVRKNRSSIKNNWTFFVSTRQIKAKYIPDEKKLKVQLLSGAAYMMHAPVYYSKCVDKSLSVKKTTPSNNTYNALNLNILKSTFMNKSSTDRKVIQSILSNLNLYKSSIDGLYGKATASALKTYNLRYMDNADLRKSYNVTKLLSNILSRKPKSLAKKPETTALTKPKSELETNKTYKVASGTGFYISDLGHIITNYHVIEGCKDITVHFKGEVLQTLIIADDRQNDLALLKVSQKPLHAFSLSKESPYPLQDIVVAGFPFGNRVSSSLKFTKGIVSSLSGLGNNYSEIQIDAAIQPGNSGGPILDEYGNIIAVAVAKLDMKKILKDYGVIPENTNFGIKASAVKNLLDGNAVSAKAPSTEVLSKIDLSRIATDGTVFLSCWMTLAQIDKMKSRKVLFTD